MERTYVMRLENSLGHLDFQVIFNPWPALRTDAMGDAVIFKRLFQVEKQLAIGADYPHKMPPIVEIRPAEGINLKSAWVDIEKIKSSLLQSDSLNTTI
jgi:hypothetical protein